MVGQRRKTAHVVLPRILRTHRDTPANRLKLTAHAGGIEFDTMLGNGLRLLNDNPTRKIRGTWHVVVPTIAELREHVCNSSANAALALESCELVKNTSTRSRTDWKREEGETGTQHMFPVWWMASTGRPTGNKK